jgi:hypothetical protein
LDLILLRRQQLFPALLSPLKHSIEYGHEGWQKANYQKSVKLVYDDLSYCKYWRYEAFLGREQSSLTLSSMQKFLMITFIMTLGFTQYADAIKTTGMRVSKSKVNYMTFNSGGDTDRSTTYKVWVVDKKHHDSFVHRRDQKTTISFEGKLKLKVDLLGQDISRLEVTPKSANVKYWVDTTTFDAYIEIDNRPGRYTVKINGDDQSPLRLALSPLSPGVHRKLSSK